MRTERLLVLSGILTLLITLCLAIYFTFSNPFTDLTLTLHLILWLSVGLLEIITGLKLGESEPHISEPSTMPKD
jgi:hypothetical protein